VDGATTKSGPQQVAPGRFNRRRLVRIGASSTAALAGAVGLVPRRSAAASRRRCRDAYRNIEHNATFAYLFLEQGDTANYEFHIALAKQHQEFFNAHCLGR
jgi:hypothetical protein